MSSSSALPPPGNLPSWSRVSTLDRSRYPKPFLRDRIPLPPAGGNSIQSEAVVDFNSNLSNMDVKILEGISASEQQRLFCYNKSIKFLQQQHSETLTKLHEELEKLKKVNKDLQFKVIMSQGKVMSPDPPSDDVNTTSISHKDDIKILLLKEEIKDLRRALKDSQQKNSSLQKSILNLQKQRNGSLSAKSSSEISTPTNPQIAGDNEHVSRHRRTFSISTLSNPLPLNATLNPLKVKDSDDQLLRVPTIPECELIIKHLRELNSQQLTELSKLRMDARELATRKLTPEPYILTTYGPGENESFSDTRLPRIPMKPLGKKHIASASSADRIVTLPALKNSIATNVADRHKRLQAVQKARSRKEY